MKVYIVHEHGIQEIDWSGHDATGVYASRAEAEAAIRAFRDETAAEMDIDLADDGTDVGSPRWCIQEIDADLPLYEAAVSFVRKLAGTEDRYVTESVFGWRDEARALLRAHR